MAESLFKTSDLFLKSADKKKMAAKFMENELAQISENVRTLIKLRGRSTKRWFLFEGYFYWAFQRSSEQPMELTLLGRRSNEH